MSKSLVETARQVLEENNTLTNYDNLTEKYTELEGRSDMKQVKAQRKKRKERTARMWRKDSVKRGFAKRQDQEATNWKDRIKQIDQVMATSDENRPEGVHYVGGGHSAYTVSGKQQFDSLRKSRTTATRERDRRMKIATRLRRDISEDYDLDEGREGATGQRQKPDQFGVGQSAPNDYTENNTFLKALARRLARAMQRKRSIKLPSKNALGRMIGEEELVDLLEEACVLGWIEENYDSYVQQHGSLAGPKQLAEDVWTSHGEELSNIFEAGLALPKGERKRLALLKAVDRRNSAIMNDRIRGRGKGIKNNKGQRRTKTSTFLGMSLKGSVEDADDAAKYNRKIKKPEQADAQQRRADARGRMYKRLSGKEALEEDVDLSEAGLALPKSAGKRRALLRAYDKRHKDIFNGPKNMYAPIEKSYVKNSKGKRRRYSERFGMSLKNSARYDRELASDNRKRGKHARAAAKELSADVQGRMYKRLSGKDPFKPTKNNDFLEENQLNEIALSPVPMVAALRIGKGDRGSATRRRVKLSPEEKAAKAKAASDWKVKQAFDALKPQEARPARKVQYTQRLGMFGRKLKPKESDFRTIPGKKARPDLQFEETEL